MGFAENLKQIRTEKYLSQEEFAEMIDVSRQAVSKWEQGAGYPEVEKLLLIAEKLNVSLDTLMYADKAEKSDHEKNKVKETILITSLQENVAVTCYKVVSTGKMPGGKNKPAYALFGVSYSAPSFWGEPTTFLGWYEKEDDLRKEIVEIRDAMAEGRAGYTLKYNVKVERKLVGMKIIKK